ncbi:MAG: energy transducer TonB [Pseudomonadota bacterium]
MAAALMPTRPNWLLRGLLVASAALHLVLILHLTGVLQVTTYTRIEVSMAQNQAPARALPRPRLRPSQVLEPSAVNPLEVPKAAMPLPRPAEVAAPARADLLGEGVMAVPQVAALPTGGLLPGGNLAGGADLDAYQEMVRARIERNKAYPTLARSRQQEGRVTMVFAIDARGRLLSLKVAKSSGTPSLDQAASQAVRLAAPFPPPPRVGPGGLEMQLTIAFELG